MNRTFLIFAGSMLLSCGASLALADEVANPPATDPVTVDGKSTDAAYSGKDSLGFISGSLYRASLTDLLLNSTITAVVGKDSLDPRGDSDLFLVAEFSRRTLPFGDNMTVVEFTFPMTVAGATNPQAVLRMRTGVLGMKFVEVDYEGDGTFVPGANYGIAGDFSFGTTPNLNIDHLIVEFKIPLQIPKQWGPGRYFKNAGQDGVYLPEGGLWRGVATTDTNELGQQSEIFVRVNSYGETLFDNETVPILAQIDVKPNDSNNINSGENGNVQVGVISDSRLNAADADWTTLKLQGTNVSTFAPARRAMLKDLNGDGLLDMLVFFDLSHGAIDSQTTRVKLFGNLLAGDPILGFDNISVTP